MIGPNMKFMTFNKMPEMMALMARYIVNSSLSNVLYLVSAGESLLEK